MGPTPPGLYGAYVLVGGASLGRSLWMDPPWGQGCGWALPQAALLMCWWAGPPWGRAGWACVYIPTPWQAHSICPTAPSRFCMRTPTSQLMVQDTSLCHQGRLPISHTHVTTVYTMPLICLH